MNELYSIEKCVNRNSEQSLASAGVTRKNKLLHKKRQSLRFIIKRTKDSLSKESNNPSFQFF